LLDRSIEALPSDAELEERASRGRALTRPEIGTLLAFAKIALSGDLVGSTVPDDPYLARELSNYFPEEMRGRFAAEIETHRLRREIIATQLANSLVNRGGPTLLTTARDRTGATVAELTRAYAAVRDSFGLRELHAEIEALDNRISGALQLELFTIVQDMLVDRLAWFARNLDASAGLADVIAHYRAGLAELAPLVPEHLSRANVKFVRETETRLKAGHVPEDLARRLALLPLLARSTDVIPIADQTGRPIGEAAIAFFAVAGRFGFGRIDTMIGEIVTSDYYEGLALEKARDSLEAAHRDLARGLLANGHDPGDLDAWEKNAGGRIAATAEQVNKILSERRPSMAKITVAASLLSELARA
jgi:glutamate dehydrogenase